MEKLALDSLENYQKVDADLISRDTLEALKHLNRKIVVLDDDPTGVQTVHGVSVYTSWDEEALTDGFREKNSIFFILTNSRGLTSQETEKLHTDIARTLGQGVRSLRKRRSADQPKRLHPAAAITRSKQIP